MSGFSNLLATLISPLCQPQEVSRALAFYVAMLINPYSISLRALLIINIHFSALTSNCSQHLFFPVKMSSILFFIYISPSLFPPLACTYSFFFLTFSHTISFTHSQFFYYLIFILGRQNSIDIRLAVGGYHLFRIKMSYM